MSAVPAAAGTHKKEYYGFINPDYAPVAEVWGWQVAKKFEAFSAGLIDALPDAKPADGYMFSSHMGAFVRTLDQAKDHYVKASLAAYTVRGSGSAADPIVVPEDENTK